MAYQMVSKRLAADAMGLQTIPQVLLHIHDLAFSFPC